MLIAGGFFVTHFFQDEVIHFVINQINKQVDTKIQVQSADFSIFRKFPNASVEFRQVTMSSVKGFDALSFGDEGEQLLSAQKIFIELNLFRLLNKDFRITKIQINDGNINLLTDEKGKHNFIFWRSQAGADTSTIYLQNITLRHVDIRYRHKQSDTDIALYAEKAELTGKFASKQYALGIDLKGIMRSLSVENVSYITDRTIEISGKLDVNDQVYTIQKTNLTIAKMDMVASGGFSIDQFVDLDLHFEGKRLDYGSIVSLLPEQYARPLADYHAKGIFSFSVDLTGYANKGNIPAINARMYAEKAEVTHLLTKIKLTNLSFDEVFSYDPKKKESSITVKSFACRMGKGAISGKFTVQNLKKPVIAAKIDADVDLSQLYYFIPVKEITTINGSAKGALSISAQLKKLSLQKPEDISRLNLQGTIDLKNVQMKLKNKGYSIDQINGTVAFDKETTLKNFSFRMNHNDFLVNGNIKDLIPYMLRQQKTLSVRANVDSRNFCVDSLVTAEVPQAANNKAKSNALSLPQDILFDISFKTLSFYYQNFKAENLTANISYKPNLIAVRAVNFSTMAGNVSGTGTITQNAKGLQVLGETKLQQLDVRQMFQTFHNFSQDVLRSEHIKGSLSGDLSFAVAWDNQMNLKKDAITVESDLTIEGGELINFKPLENLSRFVALEELQNIKFSTLHSQVFVKDQQITFPKSDINSSAFNLSGSGIHNFDNVYEYKVKILLSELLAAKARKAKRENYEHEYPEDGGKRTSLYLKVNGQGTMFKIVYDKQSAKASVSSDIRQEKQTIKGMLKEEFGWFKKDSTLQTPAATGRSAQLRFTFDEEEKTSTDKSKNSKNNQQQEDKFIIEGWD